MVGDGVGKAMNGFMERRSDGFNRQTLRGLYQGVRETVQPVAVSHDGFPFYLVQHFAHLLRGIS